MLQEHRSNLTRTLAGCHGIDARMMQESWPDVARILTTICDHPDLRDIKRIALITRTPEFYEALSFVINDPLDIRKFMLRMKPPN